MAEQQTPTPEEVQQAQAARTAAPVGTPLSQVAQAGAAAAASGGDPAQAMRDERDRVQLQMSDEDIERVAARLNELNVAEFQQRGAFDPPPERIQAPPADLAPPPPGAGEETPPPADEKPQVPQKRTAAHRFLGLG